MSKIEHLSEEENARLDALMDSIELTETGYAGINPDGQKVDRRKFPKAVPMAENRALLIPKPKRVCRECGCTSTDCTQCIEKTGSPCYWVKDDLCSACK